MEIKKTTRTKPIDNLRSKLSRYYIVQITAVMIDYVIFLLILAQDFNDVFAFIFAKIFSASFSFTLHYTKTFPSTVVSNKGRIIYVAQHLVSPAFSAAIFWFSSHFLSESLYLKILSDVFVGMTNFFIMNVFVFERKK